jgi:hypothetical protein
LFEALPNAGCGKRRRYFRREAFLAAFGARFFFAGFFVADSRAGVADFDWVEERPLRPAKMLSQLSEYCLVAPTRVMLMLI